MVVSGECAAGRQFDVLTAQAANGNLSISHSSAPPRSSSSSAGTSHGVAGYILAALGQTVSSSLSSSSVVASAHNETSGDRSGDSVSNAVVSSTTLYTNTTSSHSKLNPSTAKPRTVCTYNGQCFTDIFYVGEPIATTGSGSAYATLCSNLQLSYSAATSAWDPKHSTLDLDTAVFGGKSLSTVTYYSDASTLCDGHPRVNYSPAIPTLTKTIATTLSPLSTTVYSYSVGWIYPVSSPTCSINPTDCDGLWQAYSSSSSEWTASDSANRAMITASPIAPPCVNSSESASEAVFQSSFHACGPCTIFGDNVQLLYFPVPTTVSRDMCASTPLASLTYYDEDVVEVYTGPGPTKTYSDGTPPETAVYNGQTFTSGTAYISIGTVWAGDRCSATLGTTVSDAILAMPSESLLSLRYSQDHFQYFFITSTQTGYPFSYADMNKPIPWSAWNGQQMCAQPGSWDYCGIIYEDDFNPQLAIPPGIRKLSPQFENCQMWYGGLYDPPYALQPATALAVPTIAGFATTTTAASQASSVAATTPIATALAESTTQNSDDKGQAASSRTLAANAPFTTIAGVPVGQDPYEAGAITFAGNTLVPGGPDTIIGGTRISAATNGVVVNGNMQSYGQSASLGNGEHVEQTQAALDVPAAATTHAQAGSTGAGSTGAGSTEAGSAEAESADAESTGGELIGAGSTEADSTEAASGAVIGGVTLTAVSSTISGAIITAAGATYTVSALPSSAIALGSTTLSVGGAAATLPNGQTISAASNGAVVVQDSTVVLSAIGTAAPTVQRAAVFSISGTTVTASEVAGQTGQAIIGTQTISVGGSAYTLADGEVATLASGGLIVGSSSSTVAFSDIASSTTSGKSSITTKGTISSTTGAAVSTSAHKSSTKSGAGIAVPSLGLGMWSFGIVAAWALLC